MWTLLVWLNHKIKESYEYLKTGYEVKKARRRAKRDLALLGRLPAYLQRDMGLPPYTESEDSKKHRL
ncbi:hypothetical protein [Marinomonas profundimaris]|uniref:Uncharacterized protein n=1 Tax=Marinomonas profundimaris TaxID=1208321 RepID=W1RSG1_9GAMM|nr:hypothetical protein [Marinomonas profundimaris]ETI59937.1 hypothetical protein D104_11205 [Marinomonas profundimaris]